MAESNPTNYFDEDDEGTWNSDDYLSGTSRLVNGVTLRDLRSGSGAIFEIDGEYNDDNFEMDRTFENEYKEISHVSSSRLREDRVAPRPEQSFESLESEMEPLDSDRYVMKKIITPGVAGKIPEYAKVVIDYEFYKEHDPIPFDSTFLQGRKKKFILGRKEVIHGLEMAVRSMEKRETSKFLIKWQVAFGERGIPPRCDPKMNVFAVITLIDFSEVPGNFDPNALVEDEVVKANFNDVINKVKKYQSEGNKLFIANNYNKASSYYRRGVDDLNRLHLANEEEEIIMLELKDKMLVNLANCYNSIRRPEAACLACQEVLSRQCRNPKAFYQLGKAKLMLGNYNDCRKYLLKAKELAPKNEDINNLLKKCNDKEAMARTQQKQLYTKMFSPVGGKKENDRKPKQDTTSNLINFEKTLREVLENHFKDSVDDFLYTGTLTSEEVQICLKIAEDSNLTYEETDDGSCFKLNAAKKESG